MIQNKRQMCKAFFFTDWCAKGSMCPFAHSAEERIEELNQARYLDLSALALAPAAVSCG